MPLTISDELLQSMGMDEREARIEIACRLYNADKLSKPAACRLADLSRVDFEGELTARGLPWIRVGGPGYWEQELRALSKLEAEDSLKARERAG